jgi:hypothetical protein
VLPLRPRGRARQLQVASAEFFDAETPPPDALAPVGERAGIRVARDVSPGWAHNPVGWRARLGGVTTGPQIPCYVPDSPGTGRTGGATG